MSAPYPLEIKLASIAVHAEELLEELAQAWTTVGEGGRVIDWNAVQFDATAIEGLLSDEEVKALLLVLGQAGLLPVKRSAR